MRKPALVIAVLPMAIDAWWAFRDLATLSKKPGCTLRHIAILILSLALLFFVFNVIVPLGLGAILGKWFFHWPQ